MIRLFTCILSAAMFCSNLLPAADAVAEPVAQPQQEVGVDDLFVFNGHKSLTDSFNKEELKKTGMFFIEKMTFSAISILFFTAGLFFMYHSHKARAPLPIPPTTRLQDIIKLQAKDFLVNDILSKSVLFFLFGGWALKKVCEQPEQDEENQAAQ